MDSGIFRKSVIAAVGFFGTLGALSVGYSAYVSSLPATANSGATLSSAEWNKMVAALSTLDDNLSNLTFSGGGVGIGTANPATRKLDVRITTTDSVNWSVANSYPIAWFINEGSDGSKRGLEFGAPTGSTSAPVYIKVSGTGNRFWFLNQYNTEAFSILDTGNVGIGTTSPSAKLHVNGPMIRTIAYATANGPNDDTDVGQIASRVLNFTKLSSSTKIRIQYTDALRVTSTSNACRWEIKVGGASCPGQPLVYDYYTSGDNTHRSRTVVGYCNGIGAGSKQIQVWVSSTPGYSGADCYTGWNASTWVLEAEEVN